MSDVIFPKLPLPLSKQRSKAEAYLLSKHNLLAGFNDIEHLVTDEKQLDDATRDAILHNMLELRKAIARILWRGRLYIGTSVLDEFVFDATKAGRANICDAVIAELHDAGVDRPGFVLYPLTEFGLEIPQIFERSSDLQSTAIFNDAGFAVAAQSNSVGTLVQRLSAMAASLGISTPIERSAIETYARSSNLKWLTRNPLLLLRLTSHTGSYYENQFIYTLKIRIASAQVVMLHALSVDAGVTIDKYQSSAEVNNFETLDIRHYLIGEATTPGKAMNMNRVPMNVAAKELARLSDLAVTISTRTLAQPNFVAISTRLSPLMNSLEEGHLRYVNLSSSERIHVRVYSRLLTAIDWYRQSFGSRTKEAEAIVALAVAFETLLTDHYAPGSAQRLARRIGICLHDDPKVQFYEASVVAVYQARSEIVHTGNVEHDTDIALAQAAFAKCFMYVVSRLPSLDRKMDDPIRQLLGDALTNEEIDAKSLK